MQFNTRPQSTKITLYFWFAFIKQLLRATISLTKNNNNYNNILTRSNKLQLYNFSINHK